jgi:hypothetical protein
MPDKQLFLNNININTTFDDSFFKKIYGYSVCDNQFLGVIAAKLLDMGRKDIVQAYNIWFAGWKKENDKVLKTVAGWYHKELEKQYGIWDKAEKEEGMKECRQKQIELLQKKKLLLLTKKLMKSTEN